MSDFSKLKVKKNSKEYVLNVCTQDTEQDIIGTKNFTKLTVNGKNIVPVTGEIKYFAFNTAPDGYLVCNGANVSRETYADLFAVIGTTYGSGDGSTTFALPNLIDRFAQGSTTVGTVKSAGLPNITGSIGTAQNGITTNIWNGALHGTTGWGHHHNPDGNNGACCSIDFDASKSNSIYGNSSTVQPPALTLLPCIKY